MNLGNSWNNSLLPGQYRSGNDGLAWESAIVAMHVNKFAGELRNVLEYHGAANLTDADLWQ
jgi:hypothetical protein